MTCRELVEFLAAYLDGELPADLRRKFDAHLVACPECAAYVQAYRDTVTLAKNACRELDDSLPGDVPDGLVRAIAEALRKA